MALPGNHLPGSRNRDPPRGRTRAPGKYRSPGRAGFAVVPEQPTGSVARLTQLRTGQPSRQNDPVHLFQFGRRPPAFHRRGRSPSIIRRATTPMERRWAAKGGPEGRGCWKPRHTASASHLPARSTVSRIRDSHRCETDGQEGRLPPQRRTRRPGLQEATNTFVTSTQITF